MDLIRAGLVTRSATYWTFYVSLRKKFFQDENLFINTIQTRTTGATTEYLINGEIDIGICSPDVFLNPKNWKTGLKIIAGQINNPIYSLITQPEIKNFDSIKDKTFGISEFEDGMSLILRIMLEENGIEFKNYKIIKGGNLNRYNSLIKREIDGTLLTQPYDFKAVDEGFNNLASSSELLDDYQYNCVMVKKEWADKNEEKIIKFLRALIKSTRWIYLEENRNEAIEILSEFTGIEKRYSELTYDLYISKEKIISDECDLNIKGIKNIIEYRMRNSGINGDYDIKDFVDISYLKNAKNKI